MLSHTPEYCNLLVDGEMWADQVIPDETVGNLPSPSEPSPPPFSGASCQCTYICILYMYHNQSRQDFFNGCNRSPCTFFLSDCFVYFVTVDDDFAAQVPLPYVRKRVGSVTKKWSKMQGLIAERDHQLEISGGTIQTFFESLQTLTDWIDSKRKLDLLASLPSADTTALKEQLHLLKVLCMCTRLHTVCYLGTVFSFSLLRILCAPRP